MNFAVHRFQRTYLQKGGEDSHNKGDYSGKTTKFS